MFFIWLELQDSSKAGARKPFWNRRDENFEWAAIQSERSGEIQCVPQASWGVRMPILHVRSGFESDNRLIKLMIRLFM